MTTKGGGKGSEMKIEVPREETWDLEAIFQDVGSWQREFDAVKAEIAPLGQYSGRLLESAGTLGEFLQRSDSTGERIHRLHSYAYLRFYGNTNDLEAKKLLEQVSDISAKYSAAVSFFEPEILRADSGQVRKLLSQSDTLRVFKHRFDEIERARRHTRSPEIEAVLAQVNQIASAPEDIRTIIHDNEMQFSPVSMAAAERQLGHGNYDQFLTDRNRDVRRQAYLNYTDSYLPRLPSLGETLVKQVLTSKIFSQARNFDSAFDAAMFHEEYPPDVFWAVVNACADHRYLMQRYFRARARILGVDRIAEYDLMAPLSSNPPHVPYKKGCKLMLSSLKPLGDQYVRVAKDGLTLRRWVDVHPRNGKYSNAFSAGSYLTQPYILMNYSPTISEVGTLTHELGHSMHSHLTNLSQPSCYSNYSMSVAETASNLNQVLLRAHLFDQGDRELEIAALEEAFYFVHRYLFLMPNFALLEHRMHSACAKGEPMGYLEICDETANIFAEAYGDTLEYDRERLGAKWAQFCHLYSPFYTYQYAIGISAAMAIGGRILAGEAGVLDKYMKFLRAGASMPTLEIFKIADLDFTTRQPVDDAFKVVEGYVARLENLSVQQ
jgi:oligoendopeptidase F